MTIPELIIRSADEHDLDPVARLDRHISRDELRQVISRERVLMAELNGALAGWLRYGLFWDNTPFMNMLFLLEGYRGKGFGKALVREWERRMARAGFPSVMTSTQADESAQHFYRRIGYRDCGALFLPQQPATEIFLIKTTLA